MSDNNEFVFTWKILNIAILPREIDCDMLYSPTFTVKKFFDTNWLLDLHISSYYKNSSKHVFGALHRVYDKGPNFVEIDFDVSIGSSSSEDVRKFKGRYKFHHRDNCKLEWFHPTFQDNVCFVVCHMRMLGYEFENEVSSRQIIPALPWFFKMEIFSEFIAKMLDSFIEEMFPRLRESACQLPQSCFAETIIIVERRSVSCSMKKILNLGRGSSGSNNLQLPVISYSAIPDLLLTLHKILEDGVEYLEAQLWFVGEFYCNLNLVTKIKMVDENEKSYGFGKGFYSCKNPLKFDVLFKKLFKWSEIKQYKTSKLKFEFLISCGTRYSNMEYFHESEYFKTEYFSRTEPLLGSEKSPRYVKLGTGDKTFEAPKDVLCTMSPVFEAMFQSGMQESITDQVFIEDLESDTVESMLAFFDNGKIDKLEFEGVLNLYDAAAKYQISELIAECRKLLADHLLPVHVGDVLSKADVYQDTELRNRAVFFISENRAAVFRSKEWKCFADKNPKLGLEILKQICIEYN